MNGNYGIPRDIYFVVKIATFSIVKLVLLGSTILFSFMFSTKFFPFSMAYCLVLFPLNSGLIMLYLLWPTNGGKSNWQSFYLNLKQRKRLWISLG